MGLLDILNGMQNGPRGSQQPGQGGGMSPITMAILAMLAYKAAKSFTGQTAPAPAPSGGGRPLPQAAGPKPIDASIGNALPGDLGSLLRGGLGGLLAGGAAGGLISGGLGEILRQFQQAGHGEAANSWVGTGPNQPISPKAIEDSLGGDLLRELSQQSGFSIDDLKSNFARELPQLVDQLTPHGRIPTAQELDH